MDHILIIIIIYSSGNKAKIHSLSLKVHGNYFSKYDDRSNFFSLLGKSRVNLADSTASREELLTIPIREHGQVSF